MDDNRTEYEKEVMRAYWRAASRRYYARLTPEQRREKERKKAIRVLARLEALEAEEQEQKQKGDTTE